jgi:hypothetical protein
LCGDQAGQIRLLDAATGEVGLSLPSGLGSVRALAFDPARQLLFAAGGPPRLDGKQATKQCAIRALDLQGKQRFLCEGHTAIVVALALSADGGRLLSGSYSTPGGTDRAPVRFWDARDGRHVVTANGNGTVYVLRLPPPPRKRPE